MRKMTENVNLYYNNYIIIYFQNIRISFFHKSSKKARDCNHKESFINTNNQNLSNWTINQFQPRKDFSKNQNDIMHLLIMLSLQAGL